MFFIIAITNQSQRSVLHAQQQTIENAWQIALNSLGHNAIMSLDAPTTNALGNDGIKVIIDRYQTMISVVPEKMSHKGAIVLFPPEPPVEVTTSSSTTGPFEADAPSPVAPGPSLESKKSRKSASKIPRPPNAFILYRQHHHSKVLSECPGIHNNDISKVIGIQWKNEQQDVKKAYQDMAAEAKRIHALTYPNYQYQPRKAGDKKRRGTKHKVATVAIQQPEFELNNYGYGQGILGIAGQDNVLSCMVDEWNDQPGFQEKEDSWPILERVDPYLPTMADEAKDRAIIPYESLEKQMEDNYVAPLPVVFPGSIFGRGGLVDHEFFGYNANQ